MTNKTIFYIILSTCWALGNISYAGPIFFAGANADPQVLISPQTALNNKPGQNMEPMLVDIKAVDAPALGLNDGKIKLASVERYGQGIIIDSAGIIATNRHIIGNAQHIYVALTGGKIFTANILRISQTDLCLIKINAPFPLRAISLADSSEIRIGSRVVAIANAGFNPQRMLGGQIINVFKGKSSHNIELLEMNIPLKPGDSGGPVLNEEGSLLGLIMGKQISDPSKSYAIASNKIQQEYYNYRNTVLQ